MGFRRVLRDVDLFHRAMNEFAVCSGQFAVAAN
jgi:hypothetical protein